MTEHADERVLHQVVRVDLERADGRGEATQPRVQRPEELSVGVVIGGHHPSDAAATGKVARRSADNRFW